MSRIGGDGRFTFGTATQAMDMDLDTIVKKERQALSDRKKASKNAKAKKNSKTGGKAKAKKKAAPKKKRTLVLSTEPPLLLLCMRFLDP